VASQDFDRNYVQGIRPARFLCSCSKRCLGKLRCSSPEGPEEANVNHKLAWERITKPSPGLPRSIRAWLHVHFDRASAETRVWAVGTIWRDRCTWRSTFEAQQAFVMRQLGMPRNVNRNDPQIPEIRPDEHEQSVQIAVRPVALVAPDTKRQKVPLPARTDIGQVLDMLPHAFRDDKDVAHMAAVFNALFDFALL
jgi:hypothetical protein